LAGLWYAFVNAYPSKIPVVSLDSVDERATKCC
jgi:hypothetical protein